MRLIDADALDKAFSSLRLSRNGTVAHWGDRDDWCLKGRDVTKLIGNAPTIEVRPHGASWVKNPATTCRRWHCSNCGKVWGIVCVGFKFCPECGSKMLPIENL